MERFSAFGIFFSYFFSLSTEFFFAILYYMAETFKYFDETDSPEILIQSFFKKFDEYKEDEQSRITNAWNFLVEKTSSFKRDCGKPFYLHPLRVASILAESKMDADCIIAGLFHSLPEESGITLEYIQNEFGKTVASLVAGTTKITNLNIANKTLQQADSIRKMLFAMVDDVRIILIKLSDRLDRMRNLKSVKPEAQRAIAQEVLDIWAPLADRFGMSNVKNEMEDLSLKYSNPDVFQQIKAIVSQKKNERSQYLEKAVQAIQKSAVKAGIDVTITSRAKHFYSIYQKMRKRNKEASELFDLLALRIICHTESECYTLVGIVHGLWKPLDGRFKDYIAMPKSNGYQSLHTTVMCEGKPLEIQIRTEKMHSIAEHGVASHWLYKKGLNHDMVNASNLTIVNQLKELKDNHVTDEAFFHALKDELLGDSIFVFTPKGEVVELPMDSTAIDFAYKVHSAIGEKIVGAKADGKIIPLSTPLKNTQIIEILTNPQAHPTENQLAFVKTQKARSKIRSWLVQNNPEFEDASVHAKLVEAAAPSPKKLRVHKKSALSGGDFASRHGTGRIRIGKTTNFLINIAKCCNPVYPDPIVGYVSNGRGVIVHRADCLMFQRIFNVENRTIEVFWEETEENEKADKKKAKNSKDKDSKKENSKS